MAKLGPIGTPGGRGTRFSRASNTTGALMAERLAEALSMEHADNRVLRLPSPVTGNKSALRKGLPPPMFALALVRYIL